MMEGAGGAAYTDMLVRDGRRHSLYRAYVQPVADRLNLTILIDTLVRRKDGSLQTQHERWPTGPSGQAIRNEYTLPIRP